MKKTAVVIVFLVISVFANAQSTKEFEVNTGLMFVPQVTIPFGEGERKFLNPVCAVAQYKTEKVIVNGLYRLNDGAVCASVVYNFKHVSTYIFVAEQFTQKQGYIGWALSKPVGDAVIFAEVGSFTRQFTPGFYSGIIFPLTFEIH